MHIHTWRPRCQLEVVVESGRIAIARRARSVAARDGWLMDWSAADFAQRFFAAARQTVEPFESRQLRDGLVDSRGDLCAHRIAKNEAQNPFDFGIWLHASAHRQPKMFDDERGKPLRV